MEMRPNSKAKVVQLSDRILSKKEIVDGLIKGDPMAASALYDRFGKTVNRYVWRLLGADPEHDDVVNQIFVNVLASIKKLREPNALDEWIMGIAINTIRREIRNRKYRRIFIPTEKPDHLAPSEGDSDQRILLGRIFKVLSSMKTEEHIAFILRFIEGNTLGEVALEGGYSHATAKRRIASAKKEFLKRAKKDSILASFIEGIKNA
jgi:RNA polymerase sigma-70 factor (ECF subfamily)